MASGGNTYQRVSLLVAMFIPGTPPSWGTKTCPAQLHRRTPGILGTPRIYPEMDVVWTMCFTSPNHSISALYWYFFYAYLTLSGDHSHFIICLTPIYSFLTFCQCQYPRLVFWQSSNVEKTNTINTMSWLLYGIPVATTSTTHWVNEN